jgi:hypothetical protein
MNERYPATPDPWPRLLARLTGVPILLALLLVFPQAPVSAGCGGGSTVDDSDASTNDASNILGDNDGDGYPASEDCDDNDPDIYPGVSRDCQSDCDDGIQICLANGDWNDCTASTDCDCDNPGDTRLIDCGMCGQASQECGLDLIWEFPGDCVGEGECHVGESEEQPCQDRCGAATRLCSEECSWLPWDTSNCYGECTPGTQDATPSNCELGESQPLLCGTDCVWAPDGACTGACTGTPRSGTIDYSDEVCIDGGLALMGCDVDEGYPDERPEHIIALRPFFIDVHEVTVARYRACVLAGVCSEPTSGGTYHQSNTDDYPVTDVAWDQAMGFCAWDGGRTLPTEAQWEKAARGPYPLDVRNPWGNDPATCNHVPASDCTGGPVAVWEHPLDVSYYGVEEMGGNVSEWVSDWAGEYLDSPEPPLDPSYFPPPNGYRYARGGRYFVGIASHQDTATVRLWYDQERFDVGFRCARPGI